MKLILIKYFNLGKMNKKGDVEIDKLIILLLAVLALIAIIIFTKSSLTNSVDTFINFIKGIFKY